MEVEPYMSDYKRYFAERYQRMLLEKDFDISQETIDGIKKWKESETETDGLSSLDDITPDDVESIEAIDKDAYSDDELKDDYVGDVVLECVCCHSHITLDESKVYIDEETGTASPDIACPVCNENQGYTVLGKIEKYDVPEEKEEAKVLFPAEEEPEVEEEEEEVVEESLHDRIRRKHLQESKVCPKCGKNPCECKESCDEALEEKCEDCDESCEEPLKEGKACEDCDEPLEECGDQLKEAIQGDAIYKTVSFGGMEGRDREVRYFSSEEAARENALKDTWNDGFTLYEISFKDNDKGVERSIGRIESGREKLLADNKSLKEDINNLSLDTDDQHLEMTSDESGKVTITTEPLTEAGGELEIPDTAVPGEESVVPLDFEDTSAIETNISPEEQEEVLDASEDSLEPAIAPEEAPEEELPAEEESEEEFEVEEESFNYLGNTFAKKLYENVSSYKITNAKDDGNTLVVEGLITFNSGKTRPTKFVFEEATETKTGRIVLEGFNDTFSKGKAFKLRGKLVNGKFISESLRYNYSINRLNESTGATEPIAVRGIIRGK